MIETLKKALALQEQRDKSKFKILLLLMFVTGIFEALGALSIIPFIYVLTRPDIILTHHLLAACYTLLGFSSISNFVLFFGLFVFVFVLSGFVFKAVVNWRITKFINRLTFTISKKLLQTYMAQPYSWFLNKNSADLTKMLLTEVNQVTAMVLMPATQMIANIATASCVGLALIIISPSTAFLSVLIFGGAYSLIYLVQHKRIGKLGKERFEAQSDCFRVAHEAMGGIKEIKIWGLEDGQVINFDVPAKRLSTKIASIQMLSELPQYIFQSMAFGGMVTVLLVFIVLLDKKITSIMPLLAFYSFATLRLIPAFQKIYGTITQIRFGKTPLQTLYTDLQLHTHRSQDATQNGSAGETTVSFEKEITINQVSFAYENASANALDRVSFTIAKNTTVGITGNSGAGKTTAIDLITGLLTAQSGAINIDDVPLTPLNCRNWQQAIGYVPQHIFLTDDTVSANIALGVEKDQIDQQAVIEAAKVAEIHLFIENELTNGYNTLVGERGVRFSGGQRQRLGIARAIYKNPDLLVLDEATNALDQQMEKRILENIGKVTQRKTVILISHKLSSLQHCDKVIVFKSGLVTEHKTVDGAFPF